MRLALVALVLVFAIFVALTGSSMMPDLPERLPPTILATLERTPCYGPCPAYKLIIHTDGRVEWEGKSDVDVVGHQEATLDTAALAGIRAAFARAGFMELGEGFDCQEWTDNPEVAITFNEGGRSKGLMHDLGCRSRSGIERLCRLEEEVDLIVGSERWVGHGPIAASHCAERF